MITLDGSYGEGGGQIVRSSVALSLITGRSVTIENIRAKRKKPGLMRQHLTALQAACEVGRAEADGLAIGSRCLTFRPGPVRAGEYRFQIGTAGSTTLVLQTVLPSLLCADGTSRLILEGGTHNPFAPPFDYIAKTYLPIINRMGPSVVARLHCYGFYPAGGGKIEIEVRPAESLGAITLTEPIENVDVSGRILIANLSEDIARRERKVLAQRLECDPSAIDIEVVEKNSGPGNVVMVQAESKALTEVFTSFGQIGVKAEKVARDAAIACNTYVQDAHPVGHYLADQLMLPMAIGAGQGTGGGVFRTGELSLHSLTHIEIIRKFLAVTIEVEQVNQSTNLIHIRP